MARLFVLFARDAHEALVLRKGPSAWYHLIQWDTRRDTFLPGAWLKGRIYEEKCDVSPDGKLFVYFAHQGRRLGTSHSHAWTAVSRPPWLHALALWPHGTTYGGGGRFVGNRDLVLRGGSGEPHPDHPFRRGSLKWTSANPEVHRATDDVPGSDWCGRDQRDRVVHAVGPKLFVRKGSEEIVLADFGDARPDPKPAPAWATTPL